MPGRESGQSSWKIGILMSAPQQSASHNDKAPQANKLSTLINIVETAPYTTTVELEQSSFLPAVKKSKVLVRLYHDANMAEIVGWDRHRNWRPRYLYPNDKMYLPDEKQSLNTFLSDWLVFCCKHGYFIDTKCDGVLVTAKF